MIFSFDEFELDIGKSELRLEGRHLPVEPLVFALLSLLVENRDRLVSREEVIERIWDGRIVTDAAISTAIRGVRRVLGDDALRQVYLRTIRGRGLRFVAKVELQEPIAASVAPESVGTSSVEPASGDARGKPSVAVIPFRMFRNSDDLSAIADAIPAELISSLSRLRWLKVIARGSSFRFRDHDVSLAELRSALSVAYCLSGSIEVLGPDVTVSVELNDTRSGDVIWSERYPSRRADVHRIRPVIVKDVIAALELQIPVAEAALARAMISDHLDAWGAYHLGLQRMYRFSKEENEAATALFSRAVVLDPDFSRAHAGLSFTSFQTAFLKYSDNHAGAAQLARRHAERSLEIDPLDPMGNFAFGRALWLEGEPDSGLAWLHRATDLNPNFAQGFYATAWADIMANRAKAALENVDLAMLLSPIDPFLYAMLATRGFARLIEGNYHQGAEAAEQAARAPGAHYLIDAIAVAAHELNGDASKAKIWADVVRQRRPGMKAGDFFQAFPFKDPGTRELFHSALCKHGF
jgi:TolB-like protein